MTSVSATGAGSPEPPEGEWNDHPAELWDAMIELGEPLTWNGFQKFASAKCRELGIPYSTTSEDAKLRRKKYLRLMDEYYPKGWLEAATAEERARNAGRRCRKPRNAARADEEAEEAEAGRTSAACAQESRSETKSAVPPAAGAREIGSPVPMIGEDFSSEEEDNSEDEQRYISRRLAEEELLRADLEAAGGYATDTLVANVLGV